MNNNQNTATTTDSDNPSIVDILIARQNGKRITNVAKKTIADVATSICLVVFILAFMGISLKACEAEQAAQIERAKAHQAMLNEVAK